MTRSLVAGVLGALLLPAMALANPAPFTVTKGVSVKASGVTNLTVDCPRDATALAGAVVSRSTGVTVRDSLPTDSWRWVFRFTGLAGATNARARAAVRCLRLDPAAGTRRWKLSNFTGTRTVRLPPLASREVRVRCLSAYIATGYGISRAGAGAPRPLPPGDALVAAAIPARRSFLLRLENPGGDTVRVTANVRCLSRTASAKRNGTTVTQRFAVARPGFSDRVATGERRVVRHRCPAGHTSLATGLSLPVRDDIFMTGSHAAGPRGGRWFFNHPAGGPQRVRTWLTCLSLRTGFK